MDREGDSSLPGELVPWVRVLMQWKSITRKKRGKNGKYESGNNLFNSISRCCLVDISTFIAICRLGNLTSSEVGINLNHVDVLVGLMTLA